MMKKKANLIGSLPKRGAARCSLPRPPTSSGMQPKSGHRKQLSLGSNFRKSAILFSRSVVKSQSHHTSVYSDFQELAAPFQESIQSIIDVSIGMSELYQCLDTILKYLFAAALRAHSHKSICHLLDVGDKAPPDVPYLLLAISVEMLREGLPPSANQAKVFRKFIRKILREKGAFKSFREKQSIARRNLIRFYGFFTNGAKLEQGDDIDGDHFGIDIIIEYVGSHFEFGDDHIARFMKWIFPDIGIQYVPSESTDSFCNCSRESSAVSFDIVRRNPNNTNSNDDNDSSNSNDNSGHSIQKENINNNINNNNLNKNIKNDIYNNKDNVNENDDDIENDYNDNENNNDLPDNIIVGKDNTNRTKTSDQSPQTPVNIQPSEKSQQLKKLFNNWDTVYEATITVWEMMQNDRDFDVQELINALSFPFAAFLISALNAFESDSDPH